MLSNCCLRLKRSDHPTNNTNESGVLHPSPFCGVTYSRHRSKRIAVRKSNAIREKALRKDLRLLLF